VGPPDLDAEWSETGVEGAFRFLARVWRLVTDHVPAYNPNWQATLSGEVLEVVRALRRKTHQTLRRVTDDIERMHFNTAVSAIMELSNEATQLTANLQAAGSVGVAALSEAVENLLLMLSPFAPHLCAELWERLGRDDLYHTSWPIADAELAKEEQVTIVIQVNGKVRDKVEVPAGTDMGEVEKMALASPAVQRHTGGKQVVKVIPVPGKLVNIVVR